MLCLQKDQVYARTSILTFMNWVIFVLLQGVSSPSTFGLTTRSPSPPTTSCSLKPLTDPLTSWMTLMMRLVRVHCDSQHVSLSTMHPPPTPMHTHTHTHTQKVKEKMILMNITLRNVCTKM